MLNLHNIITIHVKLIQQHAMGGCLYEMKYTRNLIFFSLC